MTALPSSVLFACDRNSVRSPFAEGLMKRLYRDRLYVQSAGVEEGSAVDPFMAEVAAEIGVDLSRHSGHSFAALETAGEDIGGYGLIVALSPAARKRAADYGAEVDYWPVLDPVGMGANRLQRLDAYRQARDQIVAKVRERFGPA